VNFVGLAKAKLHTWRHFMVLVSPSSWLIKII